MIDLPSADREAPAPWWEATPEGAEIPVALLRIDRDRSGQDEPQPTASDALRTQARFTAGIEYIARAFGAAEPLFWDEGGVTLILGGAPAESLPERAYLGAREIWERSRIDLDLPVRIGAHVGHVRFHTDPAAMAEEEDLELCRQLAAAAPPASAALSEDVALALQEKPRADLGPLGVTARGCVPAWVLPAGAELRKGPVAIADSGDGALWDAFRHYALGRDVRDLRYVGFRLVKKEPPTLDIRDVFVPPQVELRPRREAIEERSRGRAHKPHRDAELTGPLAVRDLLTRHRHAILLGDPGCGKTTLIRWLAVTAAGGRFLLGLRAGVAERLLPLPISVGRLAEVRRAMPEFGVPAALARYFHERGLGNERDLEAFLERTLAAGHGLVLLDGLDEVHAEQRQAIHGWLAAFAAAHPKNRVIATSRAVGFVGFALPDAVEATIRPFDDAQVERYVRTFTRAYARWERDIDDEGCGEGEAEQLLGSLRASGRLFALARNPFMLSALALVHRAEGRLPRHRVQAYAIFARALCETWAEARRLVAGELAGGTIAYEEEALPILGALAFAMHRRYPAGVAPEAFVVETLAKTLEDRQGVSGEEAQRAARTFLERAGHEVQILLERGAGEWGFLHLTFQEFFTAAGLHALERFEDEAFAHLFDPRWEEVLRLGVGYLALEQKRPEAARRFVQRVLEYQAPEPERWVTSVLKKQVPLAALLAAEAGDALPEGLKKRVADAFAEWVSRPPSQERARECLEELSAYDFQEAVGSALVRTLESAGEGERNIIEAIGSLRYAPAKGVLVRKLRTANGHTNRRIALTLRDINPLASTESLTMFESDLAGERAAALYLLESSHSHMVLLAMADDDRFVRKAAADNLYELDVDTQDAQVLTSLLNASNDECEGLRAAVAYKLQAFGCIEDVEKALIKLYKFDKSESVRVEAACSLVSIQSEAMFEVLADPDPSLRMESISSLRSASPEPVRARLFAMLELDDPHARAGVMAALGHLFKDDAVLTALLAGVDDAVPGVREAALWSISSLDNEDNGGPALPDAVKTRIVAALHDASSDVRVVAASILEGRPWPGALEAMLTAASSDDIELRIAALMSLRFFAEPEAHAAVLSATNDADASVRYQAIWSCRDLPHQTLEQALLNALSDPDEKVRYAAASMLGDSAELAAVPRLLDALPTTPAVSDALWDIAERLHARDRTVDP